MSIIDMPIIDIWSLIRGRIANLIPLRQAKSTAAPKMPKSQQSGYQRNVMPGFEETDRQSIRTDRRSTLKEIRLMCATDPRIDRLLYKLKTDAAFGSFQVVVEDAETKRLKKEAQSIIDRTRESIDDKKNMRGWAKGLLRDGDLYLQLIVDAREREVIDAKKLAAEITYSRMTAEGNFPADKKPYYQEHAIVTGQVLRQFEMWEIVHLKWDEEGGQPYGKPLFASSRLSTRRLNNGEQDISVRRRLRAGQKLLHTIGTEDNPAEARDIEAYKQQNKDTIENPASPAQDYYSNGLIKIDTITGDESIGDLNDILHHEGLLSIVTGVPQSITGGGREAATNLNVIDAQTEDYHRTILDINEVFEAGFRQIFALSFLLKGINPQSLIYTFKWGAKDRDDIDKKIARATNLQKLGFSFETVFSLIGLEKLTFDMEVERIKREKAEGILPSRNMRPSTAPTSGGSSNPEPPPANN